MALYKCVHHHHHHYYYYYLILSQWPHSLLHQHSALFLSARPSELSTSSVSVVCIAAVDYRQLLPRHSYGMLSVKRKQLSCGASFKLSVASVLEICLIGASLLVGTGWHWQCVNHTVQWGDWLELEFWMFFALKVGVDLYAGTLIDWLILFICSIICWIYTVNNITYM